MYVGHDPSSTTDGAEFNLAVGATALDAITTGDDNTAIGFGALSANTTGDNNTATGMQSMLYNTTGSNNTAVGNYSLIFIETTLLNFLQSLIQMGFHCSNHFIFPFILISFQLNLRNIWVEPFTLKTPELAQYRKISNSGLIT